VNPHIQMFADERWLGRWNLRGLLCKLPNPFLVNAGVPAWVSANPCFFRSPIHSVSYRINAAEEGFILNHLVQKLLNVGMNFVADSFAVTARRCDSDEQALCT